MIINKKPVYENVLDIPERAIGEFRIVHAIHPPNHRFDLSTSRTALMGQKRPNPPYVTYQHQTRWHHLHEGPSLWMTDYPIEQYQCDALIPRMQGNILVGGLGLGYAVSALARKHIVKRIVVVEKSPEVIELVWPHLLTKKLSYRQKVEVIQADLFEYLKTTVEWFDYGFYDIWASDGENTFFHTVCPLRALSEDKVGHVYCWNEDVMRGQLIHGLHGRIWMHAKDPEMLAKLCDSTEDSIWIKWSQPFFQWYRETSPSPELLNKAIGLYVQFYGGFSDWLEVWQRWMKGLK